jgi:hypothetical protein
MRLEIVRDGLQRERERERERVRGEGGESEAGTEWRKDLIVCLI